MVIFALACAPFLSACASRTSHADCAACAAQAAAGYYDVNQIKGYLASNISAFAGSIAIGNDRPSFLTKAMVHLALGDRAGAAQTLDDYDCVYPNTGESALLRAMILACGNSGASAVVPLLQQALDTGVWDMSTGEFWGFIESSGVFDNYLGNAQSDEFREFLSQKGKVELPAPEGLTPRLRNSDWGKSEWDTSWHSLYLYVGHEYVPLLTNALKLAEEMAHFIGVITELDFLFVPIAMVIAVQHARIEDADGGCGVELAWFWPQLFGALIALFRLDSQGEDCKGATQCDPPAGLTVNFDPTKPVRFGDSLAFTASAVEFPAQYMFRFTYPGQSFAPRETDWLDGNVFATAAKWTTKCNDCDVTAHALTRNRRTRKTCGEAPNTVTYHIYDPNPYIEKITGFTYNESEEWLPCNADFDMTITPVGGQCIIQEQCAGPDGAGPMWRWVPFVNSVENSRKAYVNPYRFNPARICKQQKWVKPGDTLQFQVWAYCGDQQQYATSAWTKIFTFQDDQSSTKK